MPRARYSRPQPYRSKDKPLRWLGEWHVYRIVDGQERRVHRGPKVLGRCANMTKQEAQEKLDRLIARDRKPEDQRPDEPDVEWATRKYATLKGGSWAPPTRITFDWLVDRYLIPGLGAIPLHELSRDRCQEWLNGLAEHSKSTIHKARTYLKAICDEMVELDHMRKNPARKLDIPRSQQEKCSRWHPADECARILAACSGRDYLIVSVSLVCGLRPGELFALRVDDIEPGKLRVDETVWEGKAKAEAKTTASIGYVPLPPSLEHELRRYAEAMEPGALLFPSKRGGPMRQKNYLRRDMARIAERAGVDGLNFQSLRRTTATLAGKVGTVKDAQAMLRHASPQMTAEVYMQAIPESVQAVAAALDMMLRPQAAVQ